MFYSEKYNDFDLKSLRVERISIIYIAKKVYRLELTDRNEQEMLSYGQSTGVSIYIS